tara:strand:- start:222 stop:770 length:549 start_codon:yes stop_codon:yes gene_type:complete
MADNITHLRRDCQGILIPIGTEIILKKGSQVIVTQALGGSATVNHDGNLIRISSENLDALDLDTSKSKTISESELNDDNIDMDSVWDQLRTCYDPEIPINIVELGLIYRCELAEDSEGGKKIEIDMTLTAPGCGMGPFLVEDVRCKILEIPNVRNVSVELVFDPPWRPDMMSDEARLEAGLY